MTVHLRGDETVIHALTPQLDDAHIRYEQTASGPLHTNDLVILATGEQDKIIDTNRAALEASARLMVIELGSIGSFGIERLLTSISFHSRGGPCYECLSARIAAIDQQFLPDAVSVPSSTKRIAGAIAGEKAVSWLNDAESLAGTVIELPWRQRSLLPVPGCSACEETSTDRWQVRERDVGTSRTLEEAVAAAEQTVDDRLGIISSLGEAESRPLPYYLVTVSDTQSFSDVSAPQQAAGVADDWNEAFMKAVGEGLERYGAGVYRESSLTTGRPDEISGAIKPDTFVRPDSADEVRDAIPWILASRLSTDETVSVPAELVLFPPPTRVIRPAITTGLALENSTREAIRVGLTEVIERDATMLAWYSTYDPIGIDCEDERYQRLVRYAATEDLGVSSVLLTQDVDIPVLATAVYRETSFPRFALGSAASLDPIAASISSLQEALQNWMELRALGEERSLTEESRIARYAKEPGEALSFVTPDSSIATESLTSPDASPEDALGTIITRAADAGLDPLWTNTTPRDLEAVGFHSVRVLIPSAQPLFTGNPYFGERATRIPQELGFSPHLDRAPHPFP